MLAISAYMDRGKNFSEFPVFAAGRLRIWLIFGRYSEGQISQIYMDFWHLGEMLLIFL